MERLYNQKNGRAGLGYFIENQLEGYADYSYDVETYLNSLSKQEYEKLLNKLIDEFENDINLFDFFAENVTILIDKIMARLEEDGEKRW